MWKWFKRSPAARPTLERQLELLDECGVKLRPGARIESLLNSFGRKKYERDPFRLALVVLGSKSEGSDATPPPFLSDDVWYFDWHLDAEGIGYHGAYTAIAARMAVLAKGALPLAEIADHVDVEGRSAWLEFTLDGRRQRIYLLVDDDYVDPRLFTKLADLLDGRRAPRRFSLLDLGGWDCVIGCPTPDEFARLKEKTGLPLKWLE